MRLKGNLLLIVLFYSLSLCAQLVRPGITVHKNWSIPLSSEQNFLNSSEYNDFKALCGYEINPTSGKKTGVLSFFDMSSEDTVSYMPYNSNNENVFYSVVVSDAIAVTGMSGPFVCAGYEETAPGNKDILIHSVYLNSSVFYSNDLVINKSYDQEARAIYQEYSNSYEYWVGGYNDTTGGNKDFWFGRIYNSGSPSLAWDTTFGGPGEDVITSITNISGNSILTGYTTSAPAIGKDIYSASFYWESLISQNTYQLPGDQVLNSSYNIYGSCIAVGYSDTSAASNNKDMLIVSFDYNGSVIWTKTIGTLFNDEAFTVREAYVGGNQNYIVSGYTTTADGDKQNYVVLLDYWGNVICERIFGDPSKDDCVNTMFSLPDNCQFYLFGQEGSEQSFNEIISFNYNFDIYDVTCHGGNDGGVYFNYPWAMSYINSSDMYDTLGNHYSSGGYGDYFYDLPAGKYYVYFSYNGGGMGKSGCYMMDSVIVGEPPLFVATTVPVNLNCYGNLGSITVTPTGGTGPYIYAWNDQNNQTTATAIDLPAGPYNVTVTDYNGCTIFASQLITQSPSPSVSVISSTNILCFGVNNGSATASVSGGVQPFTYLWNDPSSQTTPIATNLAGGSYIVSVTDVNGCSASATVTITQPATALVASATGINITCHGGNNGSATVIVSGGTPGYTYLWNDPGNQTGATANNLLAGTYAVTATDLYGCPTSTNVTITEPTLATAVSISSSSNVTCRGASDGLAIASASGGTSPYTYLWNDPLSQSGAVATNLSAGIYVVNVTDLKGCTAYSIVTITQPLIDLDISITSSSNVRCHGGNNGSATASVMGGTPGYTFIWNDPGTQSGTTASSLTAGTYLVYVSDMNGCNVSTTVTISQPATVLSVTGNIIGSSCAGNDGEVHISTSGGTPVYTYLWDDFTTNSDNYALVPGTHYLTVTDANGCTFNGTYNVPYSSLPAILKGTVSYSGGNISTGEGKVTLFVESNWSGCGQFDTLTYQNLTSAGFEFTDLLPGKYFLKVDLTNPESYPNVLNTYYNDGFVWIDADTIHLACNDNRYIPIQMHEIAPPSTRKL